MMRPNLVSVAICIICIGVSAAPATITSTITLIPVPIQVTAATNSSSYKTGTGTGGSVSNYTLRYTLSYPTTFVSSSRTFTVAMPASNTILPGLPSPSNATIVTPSAQPSESFNSSLPTTAPLNDTTANLPTVTSMTDDASASASASASDTAAALSTTTPTYPLLPCILNTLYCNSPTSFSLCAPDTNGLTRYVFMGSVAAGTVCMDDNIERADDGACTPNGVLSCSDDGNTFFLCDEGGLVDMGSVADGTTCQNGQIVATN